MSPTLFCWHKWGKWGTAFQSFGGSQHQACACEKCGAKTTRRIVSIFTAQVTSSQIDDSLPKEKAQ